MRSKCCDAIVARSKFSGDNFTVFNFYCTRCKNECSPKREVPPRKK